MGILRNAAAVALALQICSALVQQQRPASSLSPGRPPASRMVETNRRLLIIGGGVLSALTTFSVPAVAAIDVTGLRIDGGGNNNNDMIAAQLRAYDGSGSARVQELKQTAAVSTKPAPLQANPAILSDDGTAATYAYRAAPGFAPRLTKVGYGERLRCDDQLVSPTGKGYLSISFEFPSDWLQLDKLLGGIQYVDQRNGDKLYLLRAKLPPDATLVTVPNKFFGDAIFDPQGAIIRGGITVEEYRVKSSNIVSDGSQSTAHRRSLIKYATTTGNGLRTERRALVDAYEVDSVAYMLMTSSNAVKFDSMGRERDTVDAIVDSFRLEKVL